MIRIRKQLPGALMMDQWEIISEIAHDQLESRVYHSTRLKIWGELSEELGLLEGLTEKSIKFDTRY